MKAVLCRLGRPNGQPPLTLHQPDQSQIAACYSLQCRCPCHRRSVPRAPLPSNPSPIPPLQESRPSYPLHFSHSTRKLHHHLCFPRATVKPMAPPYILSFQIFFVASGSVLTPTFLCREPMLPTTGAPLPVLESPLLPPFLSPPPTPSDER
jgi:hypothetical protein